MRDLFLGTGIAHTILLFAVVIALGLYLGKFKFKGISIGSTWILFIGILLSHFGLRGDPHILAFMKDFGLILFVFSIGLQVGPGFFHSFRKGGLTMNMLAVTLVLLAVLVTCIIHLVTGEDLQTMTGVMSGAVTNTPGLGAAQQTLSDAMIAEGAPSFVAAEASSSIASAYAVSYPIAVLGVIILLMVFKSIFNVDLNKEREDLDNEGKLGTGAIRATYEVKNPAIFGRTIGDVTQDNGARFVISRVLRNDELCVPSSDMLLKEGDKLLIVTSPDAEDLVKILFGDEIDMPFKEWDKPDSKLVAKKITGTKPSSRGHSLKG